ncbi:MAG: histidine kinase [Rubrivivax sp.]|nr:histidine kinase [Rubrivivax sp.]
MSPASTPDNRWPAIKEGALQAFHRYANWLVSISWKRFVLLAALLLIITAITQSLPPFRFTVSETVEEPIELPELPELPEPPKPEKPAKAPKAQEPPKEPVIRIEKPQPGASASDGVDISIDERGIRIRPRAPAAASAASSASSSESITIDLPNSATKEIVQEAIEDARRAVQDAAEARREAQQDAEEAGREAQQMAREAIAEARRAIREAGIGNPTRKVQRNRVVHWGDFLTDLALIWIIASAIIKITYKGRMQAEVKAAQATETAEAESLKRQVVEARMAAMQAQVEPHFLFNTLASIDHLIETDPPRASTMQKNLIALLRASMPTMREANASGVRDLGRELAVIKPYLEILKVRMEERLSTEIDVPEGLQSAEFPPMMIQGLVENAIKHGLEPKAEGGHLRVKAEILHGKLAVSVADTGLGFGKAATAGTGVGLANIRERLQLLYGHKAQVAVTENQPWGTVVTITVPYKPIEGAGT